MEVEVLQALLVLGLCMYSEAVVRVPLHRISHPTNNLELQRRMNLAKWKYGTDLTRGVAEVLRGCGEYSPKQHSFFFVASLGFGT